MQDAISIEGVTLAFDGRTVLDDVSLTLPPGAKCALSGDSGVGKTTVLRVLLGALRPRAGRVQIHGLELVPGNLPAIRSRLFYLAQDVRAQGDESVLDYLGVPFSLKVNRGLGFDRVQALGVFRRLRLGEKLLEQRLQDLSGGERRRVGLVRGLLLDRPLLLLDEATASVDAESRRAIVDVVLDDPNRTVLAVTHDEGFVARADLHVELVGGRLLVRSS